MKKLLFGKNMGETGGRAERPQVKKRPIRTMIAGAALIGLLGCGGGGNHDTDAGNRKDAEVCDRPGIGSLYKGASKEYPLPNLGVIQEVTEGLVPIDCVPHLNVEYTIFIQPDSTRLLPMNDDIKGRLAIYRNEVTVFGNKYNLFVYRDFDGIQLQKHDIEPFQTDKVFNIPSKEGDVVWEVHAINQTTETVAGRSVMKATFQVLNSPDRTPEQTQKDVYIVTDPADYIPVYNGVFSSGGLVNYFSMPARTFSGSIEFVRGNVWVDPQAPSTISLAFLTSAFAIVPCDRDCGTLPYADSGRNVTLHGLGVAHNQDGLVGFTLTTGFFPLE